MMADDNDPQAALRFLSETLRDVSGKLIATSIERDAACQLAETAQDERDRLRDRLTVAIDWLAEKGVPADHIEIKRMRAALGPKT